MRATQHLSKCKNWLPVEVGVCSVTVVPSAGHNLKMHLLLCKGVEGILYPRCGRVQTLARAAILWSVRKLQGEGTMASSPQCVWLRKLHFCTSRVVSQALHQASVPLASNTKLRWYCLMDMELRSSNRTDLQDFYRFLWSSTHRAVSWGSSFCSHLCHMGRHTQVSLTSKNLLPLFTDYLILQKETKPMSLSITKLDSQLFRQRSSHAIWWKRIGWKKASQPRRDKHASSKAVLESIRVSICTVTLEIAVQFKWIVQSFCFLLCISVVNLLSI